MRRLHTFATAACLTAVTVLATPAWATQQNTFTGVWAPTATNGFLLTPTDTEGTPMPSLTVSSDGLTLMVHLDATRPEVLGLENYGYDDFGQALLPTGTVSYDYQINVNAGAPGSSTDYWDIFGNRASMIEGQVALSFSGHVSIDYAGNYLSLFQIGVWSVDGRQRGLPFSADVVLTNFSAPVPEPATWAMAGAGLALLAAARRRQARG